MTALSIAKTATSLVVSLGAGAVVSNAIKASIPANSRVIAKIAIGVGGFVLSSMVGEMASNYVSNNIDKAREQFTAAKEDVEHPESPEETTE